MKKNNLPPSKEGIKEIEEVQEIEEIVDQKEAEVMEDQVVDEVQNESERSKEGPEKKIENESIAEKLQDNLSSFFNAEEIEKVGSIWFRALSKKQFLGSMGGILLLSFVYIGVLYYLLSPETLNGVSFLLGNRKNDSYQKPLTSTPSSFILELSNPEDNSLVFDNSVIVSGTASPNSYILISSNDYDYGLEVGTNGQFSQVFSLIPGLNIIKVAIFDESGNSKSLMKNVYYSTEKI